MAIIHFLWIVGHPVRVHILLWRPGHPDGDPALDRRIYGIHTCGIPDPSLYISYGYAYTEEGEVAIHLTWGSSFLPQGQIPPGDATACEFDTDDGFLPGVPPDHGRLWYSVYGRICGRIRLLSVCALFSTCFSATKELPEAPLDPSCAASLPAAEFRLWRFHSVLGPVFPHDAGTKGIQCQNEDRIYR